MSKNGNGYGRNSFFERLLNITGNERQRVVMSWVLSFFYRVGFVVGWTSVTAIFIAKFGIAYFPVLFILNGFFIIIGTVFYSQIIHKVEQNLLIMLTVLAGAITFFIATFFPYTNSFLFFGLLIVAESVFIAQLYIILTYFIEDLFTPLESERTFPVIESAETIGGIVGGAIVSYFAVFLPLEKLIFLWIIFIAAIIPVIFYHQAEIPKLSSFVFHKRRHVAGDSIKKISTSIRNIRKIPYLKGLVLILLTQWIFVSMLEFQYTKAIEQNVTHREEETLAHKKDFGRIFQIALLNDPRGQNIPENSLKLPKTEPLEEEQERSLARKLGSFQIIFGLTALIAQLFVASRIIHKLGIVGSLLLHPIIMLISLIGLFLKYGFVSALITKANFEASTVVFKSAYNTSYYAMRHDVCENAREFLEGYVKPSGAIFGMTLLIFFYVFLDDKYLTMSVNITMVIILTVMLFSAAYLPKKYTMLSKDILFSPDEDEIEKWKAVEILGQRGHIKGLEILFRGLGEYENYEPLKVKILESLGALKNTKSLPLIVGAFSDRRKAVRLAAVKAIRKFGKFGKTFFNQAFTRYHLSTALKKLFREEPSPEIRLQVIKAFSMLQEPDTVSFLLQVLNEGTPDIKAQCIKVCGLFEDPSVISYIEPYLKDESPMLRASAVSALWQFSWIKNRLLKIVHAMMKEGDKSRLAIFSHVGNTAFKEIKPYLHGALSSTDENLFFYASLLLSRKEDAKGLEALARLLPKAGPDHLEILSIHFFETPPHMRRNLQNLLSRVFSEYINDLIRESGAKQLHEFETPTLEKLIHIYTLLGQRKETFHIQRILSERSKIPS